MTYTSKINLILLSIIVLGFNTRSIANDDYTIKSKINKVTVYQEGAQIQRRANYSVSKGITQIVIENLSAYVDPNSIQINATGQIILLDSKFSVEYPTPEINPNNTNIIPPKIQKEIRYLKDSIFDYSYRMLDLQLKIDVLTSEKSIITNNGSLKGQGKVNDSIQLLKEAIDFYHLKMNKINHELLTLQKKKDLISRVQSKMNNRLTTLNSYNSNNNYTTPQNNTPIYKVVITVSAKESTSGRLNLSYLVSHAGWTPMYDLRSEAKNSSIQLTYKAKVHQNTGILWKNVKLNLSTNNPYANKTKPELTPWYLNYTTSYYRNTNKPSSTITYAKKESRDKSAKRANYESASIDLEEISEAPAMTSNQFTQVIEQLISVEYAIDLPYTIKSNNEQYMVLVDSKTLDTQYKYYAVPKLDMSTYLVAQITNLSDLNLIPGNATIFHDGAYLGVTYLNPSIMSDTMNLSLGKDPQIQIKKTLLKNESKEKVIGDKVLKKYAYHIQIKNHKGRSIKITLQDQIPITQNSEIEIELVNGDKGKLNEITGLIEWNLKLKSKETKTIDLVYTIKYNKTQPINLTAIK